MTTYKHVVQVHPVENGLPNLYKVLYEVEYDTQEEAESVVDYHNEKESNKYPHEARSKAVYYGRVNDATGEME